MENWKQNLFENFGYDKKVRLENRLEKEGKNLGVFDHFGYHEKKMIHSYLTAGIEQSLGWY